VEAGVKLCITWMTSTKTFQDSQKAFMTTQQVVMPIIAKSYFLAQCNDAMTD